MSVTPAAEALTSLVAAAVLMAVQLWRGLGVLAMYTVVMALHFLVVDVAPCC